MHFKQRVWPANARVFSKIGDQVYVGAGFSRQRLALDDFFRWRLSGLLAACVVALSR